MKTMAITLLWVRSFLKRNKIFFEIVFGVVTAIGVIYAIIHPNIKETTKTQTAKEQTEGKNYKPDHPSVAPSPRLALDVGKDSVVIGNVPPDTKIGEGSIVIGPTDNKGNTIINTPMAVGRGAKAGPGSIAIGAGAGAGSLQEQSPTEKQNKK